MSTLIFERIVKKNDSVRFPFVGNASGETWNAQVYEINTSGGTDTEITTGITVGSAVSSTGLYFLNVAPTGLTAGKMYYAFVTRPADGAVVRFPAWAYAPDSDTGSYDDDGTANTVFGKLKYINNALGASSFGSNSTNLYAMLTDGTNGLSAIKTAVAGVASDTSTIKAALAGDVATAFTGVSGVTDMATALKKIYDNSSNPWDVDISGYTTSGLAGTTLKLVAGVVGFKNDSAASDYTNATVQAKLRKLGEWVEARLPSSGYANSTTDVAAGQAAIYSRLGAPTGASLAADIASVYSLIGAPAGASVSADVAAVKSELDLVKDKTDLIGAAADDGSASTLFGKVAAVQAVVDRLNKIANAQLLPIVPTEVASPAVSVSGGIAIKFELKVTDPSTGALDDADTWDDSGTTRYKSHVRVTDLNNQHWGARLFADGAFSSALGASAGAPNEPVYSCTPLGGGASSEAFRRLNRESQGQYSGYIKILPADNTTLNFLFLVVDSDPTSQAKTFVSYSTMVVRQPASVFPTPGGF